MNGGAVTARWPPLRRSCWDRTTRVVTFVTTVGTFFAAGLTVRRGWLPIVLE